MYVWVCIYVCARETGKKKEIQFCLLNVKEKNQCLWNVSHKRKLLKNHSIFQLFLNKWCLFTLFWKCTNFVFLSFGSIKPSRDEEDCDYSLSKLSSLVEKSIYIPHFFFFLSFSSQVSLGQFINSDFFIHQYLQLYGNKTPKVQSLLLGIKNFVFHADLCRL